MCPVTQYGDGGEGEEQLVPGQLIEPITGPGANRRHTGHMGVPSRQWADAFGTALRRLATTGGPAGGERDEQQADGAYSQRHRFLSSLPPGYGEQTAPEDAARDWLELSELVAAGGVATNHAGLKGANGRSGAGAGALTPEASRLVVTDCRQGAPGDFRLRRAGRRRMELSSLLPVLESFGLAVVEAVPWHFVLGAGGEEVYVDDIGLRVVTPVIGTGFDSSGSAARLVDAINAVLAGKAELSELNCLVVGAGLNWREVNLMCAYAPTARLWVGGERVSGRSP